LLKIKAVAIFIKLNFKGREIKMEMARFTYVMYVLTTPENIWNALIDPNMTEKYWKHVNISDWQPGSRWEHRRAGKEEVLVLVGKVIEFSPPRRLVLSWAYPIDEAREERQSRVAIEIEPIDKAVRLTVTHDQLDPDSKMLYDITEGWPKVISSLKTFIETGKPLPELW
jgi:uncharacterized protein YndB with AHSA1/START domain